MEEEKDQNIRTESNQDIENKIPIERVENLKNETSDTVQRDIELKLAQEKISELEKQILEFKDTLLRKVAEFENYKRRNENDQLNFLKYAAESFIMNTLPIYDDLERSLSHIDDANNFNSIKKGLQLVFEKFEKIFEAQGVKRIDAKGKPFDVHFHEALMQQPVEGVAPHTVLDVIEHGYVYKDKVIRHAKVIVSQELEHPEIQNNETENKNND